MAIANYQRSLPDAVIKAIAGSGGDYSINMAGAFMDKMNPDIATTDALLRDIDHMANLAGLDHVGTRSPATDHLSSGHMHLRLRCA